MEKWLDCAGCFSELTAEMIFKMLVCFQFALFEKEKILSVWFQPRLKYKPLLLNNKYMLEKRFFRNVSFPLALQPHIRLLFIYHCLSQGLVLVSVKSNLSSLLEKVLDINITIYLRKVMPANTWTATDINFLARNKNMMASKLSM